MNHKPFHNSIRYPIYNRRGSIMIWVVALGFLMMSSFFLFSMRQRMSLEARRETIEIMNTQMYMESLAEYFMKHPEEKDGDIDKVSYTLTRKTDIIEGSLDVGESEEYPFTGESTVDWNKCADNMGGDLSANGTIYPHTESSPCNGYSDSQTIQSTGTLTLKAPGAPFFYRIRPIGTAVIDGPEWHLTMNKTMEYGKVVTVKKTFPVRP